MFEACRPQPNLVVEQPKPSTIRSAPWGAETPERDGQVPLGRSLRRLCAHAFVVSHEIVLPIRSPSRRLLFQRRVLGGQGFGR